MEKHYLFSDSENHQWNGAIKLINILKQPKNFYINSERSLITTHHYYYYY